MIQPPGTERAQVEEELPDVFTFHLALSRSSTYYRWREVGRMEQLASDDDVACLLLHCYEKGKRERQTEGGVCTRCQSPLTLQCVHCSVDRTHPMSALPPLYGNYSQTHNLQKDVTPTHSQYYPGVSIDLNLSPACLQPGLQSAPQYADHSASVKRETEEHSSLVLNHQHSTAAQVVQLHTEQTAQCQDAALVSSTQQEHSQQHCALDHDSALSATQDDSDSLSTEETLNYNPPTPSLPTPTEPPGRGRPRLYPAVNLVCEVCGRKLSSRQALFKHMTSRHPSSQLPPSLSHLAAKRGNNKTSAGRTRSSRRRSSKKPPREDERGSDQEEEEEESKTALKERLQRRKAELESLKCETCSMKFDSKRQMYTHRRLCQWKVCHVCGKSVKQLEMHLKRHSAPRRFPCPHCPKTFLFRNYLEGHLLYHTGQRPFCCEICGARYREKTRLNAHLRTHTGIKPFKCSQCDAAFTRPRGLHDHMRVHTGEKPYACQVCGRQFSSSGNLAAHRRKVHKLQPQVPNRLTRKLFVEPGLEPTCDSMGEV